MILTNVKGTKTGSITLIYSHETKNLESDLTAIQHHFESTICATMHVHLSKEKCLETIAVKGEAKEIKWFAEKLKTRREG